MNYWLHRISHCLKVSYPLLEKGYMTIGFSDFCNVNFLEKVVKTEDWDYFEKEFKKNWGQLHKSRYSLWRFIVEMQIGDWVVIPGLSGWGNFSVYQIESEAKLITDTDIDLPEKDWNENRITRDSSRLLKVEKDIIDLGFCRKISPVAEDISRADYADARLTKCMKFRGTNINISDLKESIKKAVNSFNSNQPIDLHAEIIKNTVDSCLAIINEKLNPDKFEYLIKWYFDRVGADSTEIPAKNSSSKQGDADIIATFEQIRTIIYVQAKFHEGTTDPWAIEQIKDFSNTQEKLSDGYNRQYWVVSTADGYSDEALSLAAENNILLLNGKEFVYMIMNAGLQTLKNFDY